MAHRPPPLSSLYEWYHFDHGHLLIKNYYVFIMHYTTNTHYTTSTLSGSQHILSLLLHLSHPLPPLPPPANADLSLHTKIFPTILGYEVISITNENTYKIVLVSFYVLFFSYLPIRRFDRQEEAFSDWPTPSCLGSLWIGGREIFSDVIFHSEAQYENHDSKVTVNHFNIPPLMSSDYFWAAQPMCYRNDFCGTRRRVEWMLTPLLPIPLAVVDPWGGHG